MISFSKPKTVIVDDHVVVANIFQTADHIYVIGTYYMADGEGDCYIGNTDNLRFCIDGFDVNFESFFAASGRADRFRIYRISNERKLENKTLKIIHEGASYNFKLTVDVLIDAERVRISATTIFKDDYRLLGPYISHYRKLGVHCFDLYYNGKINDLLIRQDFDRFVVSVSSDESVKMTW